MTSTVRFRSIFLTLISILAVATASAAGAQQGANPVAEQFGGETTVTVVEVPVQVFVDGEPLRGLTADDFVIYDQGERRKVQFFEQVDFQEVAAWREEGEETEVPAAARRHFLLFFDLDFTPGPFIAKAQQAALHLVREGLEPTDLVGVAFFHGKSGNSSVIGFTSDRQQVIAALEELGRLVGADGAAADKEGKKDLGRHQARRGEQNVQGDSLGLTFGGWGLNTGDVGRYVDKERNLADETLDWLPGGGGGKAPDGVTETIRDMANYAEQDVQQRRASRASALVDALRTVARQTRFIDGAKYLLLFSQGFESSLYTEEGHSWLYSELEDAIEELRRAGWTLNGIDTGEVWADWRRRQKRESLALMAEATGGEVYVFAADPTKAVANVVERTNVTYVLGFQTGEIPMDGSFRELRVELADGPKGVRLNHRTGYFTPRRPTARDAETWTADAGELLLAGEEQDEIGVLTQEGAIVPVLVEIDGAGLSVGAGGGGPRRIDAYIYAFSPSGEVEAAITRQLPLDPSRLPSPAGGFKLIELLELPAGEHQVRTLVRNADTGQVSLRTARVVVPRSGDTAPHLLPPVFVQEANEPWLLVGHESGEGQAGDPFPFQFQRHRFLPSAGPVLERDAHRPLLLLGYGLPADGKGLRVRVVDALGDPVQGATFAVAGREAGAPGAPDVIALNLAPGTLQPGTYQVEAAMTGGTGWVKGARFRVVEGAGS